MGDPPPISLPKGSPPSNVCRRIQVARFPVLVMGFEVKGHPDGFVDRGAENVEACVVEIVPCCRRGSGKTMEKPAETKTIIQVPANKFVQPNTIRMVKRYAVVKFAGDIAGLGMYLAKKQMISKTVPFILGDGLVRA